MPRFLTFCTLVLTLTSLVRAAEVLPRVEIDRLVAPLIDGQWCEGIVVGLVRLDDSGTSQFQFAGYGRKSADDATTPDESSVFEIGSITKAFTGILLAEMAERGELSIDDPVQKHLPDDVKLRQAGEEPITLVHLATQYSGLPRMPLNFQPADAGNPFADYTADLLYDYLKNTKPSRKPGEKYEYSNLGLGLLGHVLARRGGKSYEAMIVERIADPLGMSDTRIVLSEDQRKRLVPGHDRDGNPIANWDFDALAPAGALRSTAADLAKFVAANLQPPQGTLGKAIQTAQQIRVGQDEGMAIGLCWQITKASRTIWHNGQTGAYHSFVGFIPEKKFGVVVLSNTAAWHIDRVADGLLRRLLDLPADPPKLQQPITFDAAELEKFVGKYRMTLFFALTITQEDNKLFCQATGQERFRIYPESKTKFFWKEVDAQVSFDVNEDGKVTGLTLHQNGKDQPAKRVE
jgi:CubicO group peptidase (beta-lactamase class C family)